ncbi:unnamed protein product [Polarella glacialis]|uniref:Uncharacterized protein n=1 Tax=Polarella glacialis TaxID=89957 RepID=A0A813E937_POLGL|nr:unnamed protein product [Polarella glacialis]
MVIVASGRQSLALQRRKSALAHTIVDCATEPPKCETNIRPCSNKNKNKNNNNNNNNDNNNNDHKNSEHNMLLMAIKSRQRVVNGLPVLCNPYRTYYRKWLV